MKKQSFIYSAILALLLLGVGVVHCFNPLPGSAGVIKNFSAQVVSTTPVVLVYPTPGSFTNLTSLFVGNESAVTTDVVLNNGSGSITMPLAVSGANLIHTGTLYSSSAGATWLFNTTNASATVDVGGQYYQTPQ